MKFTTGKKVILVGIITILACILSTFIDLPNKEELLTSIFIIGTILVIYLYIDYLDKQDGPS